MQTTQRLFVEEVVQARNDQIHLVGTLVITADGRAETCGLVEFQDDECTYFHVNPAHLPAARSKLREVVGQIARFYDAAVNSYRLGTHVDLESFHLLLKKPCGGAQ